MLQSAARASALCREKWKRSLISKQSRWTAINTRRRVLPLPPIARPVHCALRWVLNSFVFHFHLPAAISHGSSVFFSRFSRSRQRLPFSGPVFTLNRALLFFNWFADGDSTCKTFFFVSSSLRARYASSFPSVVTLQGYVPVPDIAFPDHRYTSR